MSKILVDTGVSKRFCTGFCWLQKIGKWAKLAKGKTSPDLWYHWKVQRQGPALVCFAAQGSPSRCQDFALLLLLGDHDTAAAVLICSSSYVLPGSRRVCTLVLPARILDVLWWGRLRAGAHWDRLLGKNESPLLSWVQGPTRLCKVEIWVDCQKILSVALMQLTA